MNPAMRTGTLRDPEAADRVPLIVDICNKERRALEWLRAAIAQIPLDVRDSNGLYMLDYEASCNLAVSRDRIADLCAPWFTVEVAR